MCWKLHGRPSQTNNNNKGWKTNNGQQQRGQRHANLINSNQSNNENEIQEHGVFKKENTERLKSLESLEKPPSACSLALLGKYSISHAFNVMDFFFLGSWVIGLGAKFVSYTQCPSNKKIFTINGSLKTNPYKPIMYPKKCPSSISTNLVSIHQITKDMNCNVIFQPSYYVSQDQGLGKMIRLTKKKDGFYYLDASSDQNKIENKFPLSYFTESSISNKDKI